MTRASEPLQADTSLLAGRRVLVVEDSPADLERLTAWLAKAERVNEFETAVHEV